MELTARNVTGSMRGKDMLRDFNASFPPGVTAVIGPDGCGKSALLSILAGSVRQEKGEILFSGKDIASQRSQFLDRLGYMPERLDFPRGKTVGMTLQRHAAEKGLNKLFAAERIATVMNMLGLTANHDTKISDCTEDAIRRVGIASAMLSDPDILLLDRPTMGLLPAERMRFNSIMTALSRSKIVIYTADDIADAESGVDFVVFMAEGRCLLAAARAKLVSLFTGKVWRVIVPLDEAYQVKLNYAVTSQQRVAGEMRMRIVATLPPSYAMQATLEEPALRDVYGYCMSRGTSEITSLLN